MTRAEQIIEIDRIQREVARSRLEALASEARYKFQSDRINTALEMIKVWSAFNIAAMWGYRDPDLDSQEPK